MIDSAPAAKLQMSEPRMVARPLTIGRRPYSHPDTGAARWEVFAEFQGTGIGRIVVDDVDNPESALAVADRLTNVVRPAVAFEEVITQHGRNEYESGYDEGVREGRAQAEAEARVKAAAARGDLFASGGDDDDRDGEPLSDPDAVRVSARGHVETIVADMVGYAAPSFTGRELAHRLAAVVTAQHVETEPALRDLYRALALVLASAVTAGE